MTLVPARAARTLSLSLSLLSPACFVDKGDTSGIATDAGVTGSGTAVLTSSDATTGDAPPTTSDPTTPTTQSDDTAVTDSGETDTNDAELCAHLGHESGIKDLVDKFVARVLVDERINAYFLTTEVDVADLTRCLAEQLGDESGCGGVVYTCEGMKSVHAGMGISLADFNDLADDFSAAMDAHQAVTPALTNADKAAILGVLGTMANDIVEDDDDNATLYQRLGRKPGVAAVIGDVQDPKSFLGLVTSDATIAGFFATSDFDRLATCLVRQMVEAAGGPQIYGKEVSAPTPADPGVSEDDPCRDMKSSHAGLMDPTDSLGIEFADFNALVGHLVTAMDNFTVPMTEQNAVLGALGPLCTDIVTVDPALCG